ncbi:NAD(+) kinase [Anaerosporomusa subterranea]|uniref:NAD kinase n=2 Tax=Anaerosporomusa subterranea TaxID=1794912 RepID=A0A154BV03_ANASB|nr:NAD(+) kinase [Anaerosporomusa subterranea]
MPEIGGSVLTIGIYPNMEKTGITDVVCQVADYLIERGARVLLPQDFATACDRPMLAADRDIMMRQINLGITLGGDGTILHVARELAQAKIPVCGINMGNLGFLTAAELSELQPALDKLLTGDYLVEERMMLVATVLRQGETIFSATALNDVVMTNSASPRLIRLNVYVDEELIAGYPADGFILATSTGATGYSLSAGGPVVSPHVEAMILTPICPHTLYSRALVVSRQETVEVRPQSPEEIVALTIDGKSNFCMIFGDALKVTESPEKARLVRFNDKSYYQTLHRKLRRGEIDATS